jgi:alkylhydroperoxidase family enzyme
MTWLAASADGATPLRRVMAMRPDLAVLLDDYLAQVWIDGDPVILELCRLRIATLHRDEDQQRIRHAGAVEAGVTEAQVAALADYVRSPHFSDHERRCLAYAEQYVIDVHGITDADADAVKSEMTDAGFVAFTVALGLFDGIGRLRLMLDVAEPVTDRPVLVPTPSAAHPAH